MQGLRHSPSHRSGLASCMYAAQLCVPVGLLAQYMGSISKHPFFNQRSAHNRISKISEFGCVRKGYDPFPIPARSLHDAFY